MSSVLPQPAEEVLERRRDGLQHPREDVEEAPRALLATAAAVVAVAVLLPAALAALLVPLVFDLPLLLRVRVVDDDLCGRSCVWLSGFTYTVGRICLTRGSSQSNIGLFLRML